MSNQEIPKVITEAATAILRPYAPTLTPEKLTSAISFVPENESGQLLTRKEAAEALSISTVSLDRMTREGGLPRLKIRRAVRIPKSAVDAIKQGATGHE